MEKTIQYIALFAYNKGEAGYSVLFPDIPGCVSYGKNFDDALYNAREAMELHISNIKKDGEEIPKSRTLEQIKEQWEDWQEWKDNYDFEIVPIRFFGINKHVKYSLYLDQNLMNRIDAITKNRSAFFADAAKQVLGLK